MYEQCKIVCRLCGNNPDQLKNIVNNESSSPDLCKTIEQHFSVQIDSNNQAGTAICNDCENFLLKLIEFEETVRRTQIQFVCHEIEPKNEEDFFEDDQVLAEDQLVEQPDNLEIPRDHKFSYCNICGDEFASQSYLIKHQSSMHPKVSSRKSNSKAKPQVNDDVRRFLCDECGRAYKSKGDLARHKEFHRDQNDTPFACNICGKKFTSKLVKAMHQKRHGEQHCTCSICGNKLKNKNTLRNHMLMHSDELKFKCEHCDKRFRSKKNMTMHLVTHSGVKPFTCAFCSQAFSLRANLKTHQKKIHPKELAIYEREGKITIITDVVKKKFACGQREAKNLPSS